MRDASRRRSLLTRCLFVCFRPQGRFIQSSLAQWKREPRTSYERASSKQSRDRPEEKQVTFHVWRFHVHQLTATAFNGSNRVDCAAWRAWRASSGTVCLPISWSDTALLYIEKGSGCCLSTPRGRDSDPFGRRSIKTPSFSNIYFYINIRVYVYKCI